MIFFWVAVGRSLAAHTKWFFVLSVRCTHSAVLQSCVVLADGLSFINNGRDCLSREQEADKELTDPVGVLDKHEEESTQALQICSSASNLAKPNVISRRAPISMTHQWSQLTFEIFVAWASKTAFSELLVLDCACHHFAKTGTRLASTLSTSPNFVRRVMSLFRMSA